MITVEDLLQAYAYAYDAWLDPEAERKNPIPEYAEFIRRSVSWENAKLRELVRDMRICIDHACMCEFCPLFVTEEDMGERRCIADMKAHMRELGVDDG